MRITHHRGALECGVGGDDGVDAMAPYGRGYRVDLQSRFALPFSSFIMAFIGIPFALQQGRGASLAVGIAVSVTIGVAYHLAQGTLLAFGYSGALPILLAAWGPNLAFGLLGFWLLTRTR